MTKHRYHRSGELLRQALKGPMRRLLRKAGYEIINASLDPQRAIVGLLDVAGITTLLDVGANQGQYAEHMRATGFTGRIVSFEPGRRAFARLASTAEADPAWDVRRLALGAAAGEVTLHVSANSVSSSLLPLGERHLAAAPASSVVDLESVRLSRLDVEMVSLAGPAMLKIDTQGFELPVLQGSEGVLERISVVQAELSLVELYDGSPSYLEVLRHLEDRGFKPWAFLGGFADPETGQMLQVDVVAHRPGALR